MKLHKKDMFNEYLIFFKITWVKLREKNGKLQALS